MSIDRLIQEEQVKPFTSHHEAWAVTKEELEELLTEIDRANLQLSQLLWQQVKENSVTPYAVGVLRGTSIAAIESGVKMAALCEKWLELLEKEKTAS